MAANNQFQPPIIPRDSDGFVKAFTLSSSDCPEAKEAREFFQEYGFVVIANVFTEEQCRNTISDIWNVIESLVGKTVRDNEELWTPKYVRLYLCDLKFIVVVLDFGIEQVFQQKALSVVLVFGLAKSYSIDKLQLYTLLMQLYLEQTIL